jgi:hypothetical protein
MRDILKKYIHLKYPKNNWDLQGFYLKFF